MAKKSVFVANIETYEIIPPAGSKAKGFCILFDEPIDIKLIAEWVGRKTKITFEEQG